MQNQKGRPVAPFTGAWIEIKIDEKSPCLMTVAPFTGAWIEIGTANVRDPNIAVAPFTGAWIEIRAGKEGIRPSLSLPSRGRGLKSFCLVVPVVFVRRSLHGGVD